MISLHRADCLIALEFIDDNSLDALITDPPAGISFMGKSWDDDKGGRKQWIAWMSGVMQECYRVMKPGAHGLVWAIPRTSHWTATALEDAGFEIRDVITHLFGSGFPKSQNISIAIDKQAKALRHRGVSLVAAGKGNRHDLQDKKGNWTEPNEHKPITAAAAEWQGWGTALKPASEHWILIRKPCSEKTVAANVLKWGVGGINIDGSRITTADNLNGGTYSGGTYSGGTSQVPGNHIGKPFIRPTGRFPANLVLSCSPNCTEDAHDIFDCPIALMDEQSGVTKSGGTGGGKTFHGVEYEKPREIKIGPNQGGASRFFYCAKASKADKNAGLEGMPKKVYAPSGGAAAAAAARGEEYHGAGGMNQTSLRANFHPTVKSTKLMQYLIKLITPPNGTVLDPFMGSGSTGVSAVKSGFKFIGIEKEKEYFEIAKKRIDDAKPS